MSLDAELCWEQNWRLHLFCITVTAVANEDKPNEQKPAYGTPDCLLPVWSMHAEHMWLCVARWHALSCICMSFHMSTEGTSASPRWECQCLFSPCAELIEARGTRWGIELWTLRWMTCWRRCHDLALDLAQVILRGENWGEQACLAQICWRGKLRNAKGSRGNFFGNFQILPL